MFFPSCDKEISSKAAYYCHHSGKGRLSLPSKNLFVIVSVELRSILTMWKPNNDSTSLSCCEIT